MKEPRKYYQLIQNEDDDSADLYIFGDISTWPSDYYGDKSAWSIVKELKELKARAAKTNEPLNFKADRKTAIEMLRQEKYNIEFRNLFRTQFGKMAVLCPAFPDLESVDGVSPPR